jgi:hypothetical protein
MVDLSEHIVYLVMWSQQHGDDKIYGVYSTRVKAETVINEAVITGKLKFPAEQPASTRKWMWCYRSECLLPYTDLRIESWVVE